MTHHKETGRELRKTLLWLPLAAVISGCGESETATTGTPSRSASAGQASCVADYAQRPCELLTPELVKGVYPYLPDLPSTLKTQETLATTSCQHSWAGERTQILRMGNNEIEVPLPNRVAISWIDRKDGEGAEERFRNTYRTLSEEEKAATMAALDRELEKQATGMSDEQKALAGGIGRGLVNTLRYQPVEGVATAAAWDARPQSSTLKVLDTDTAFGIEADISADSDVNRELAIALARAVMAACR